VPAIIAIDPGLTGAIATLVDGRLHVADMPVYTVRKATRVNLHDLAAIITNARTLGAYDALVEHVGSMPKQGVASAFNFGFTTGAIHGILAALGMESHTVAPPQWRFGVGLPHNPKATKKQRKAASRARAIELFPDYAHLFARAKDDGRADAALMAWWHVNKSIRAGA
jgi:hypothetical protein